MVRRAEGPLPRKGELIGEIAKAEALLARLEAEQGQAQTRLAALRKELASQGQPEPGIRVHLPATPSQPVPRSPEEKVSLLRRLFRGRADVFPTRFVSKTSRGGQRRRSVSKARLREMIEEATVDAYGESEQIGGFYTTIDEHLALPFETTLLGMAVTVTGVDVTEGDESVAICSRGRPRRAIPILDLALPPPAPIGAEWIEAHRHWTRSG